MAARSVLRWHQGAWHQREVSVEPTRFDARGDRALLARAEQVVLSDAAGEVVISSGHVASCPGPLTADRAIAVFQEASGRICARRHVGDSRQMQQNPPQLTCSEVGLTLRAACNIGTPDDFVVAAEANSSTRLLRFQGVGSGMGRVVALAAFDGLQNNISGGEGPDRFFLLNPRREGRPRETFLVERGRLTTRIHASATPQLLCDVPGAPKPCVPRQLDVEFPVFGRSSAARWYFSTYRVDGERRVHAHFAAVAPGLLPQANQCDDSLQCPAGTRCVRDVASMECVADVAGDELNRPPVGALHQHNVLLTLVGALPSDVAGATLSVPDAGRLLRTDVVGNQLSSTVV
ncbi:MAG: hypothetical protein IT564_12870, partial [Rhodospirillales bacterium]|nr:hypothetical protein [Rhodospirillales bacterium]